MSDRVSPPYPFDPGSFASAFDTDLGRELWHFLNERSAIHLMEYASDRGRPAVEPLQEPLLERFEQEAIEEHRIRQMIGFMARQVLARSGYDPVTGGVAVKGNGLFTVGTLYRRRHDVPGRR